MSNKFYIKYQLKDGSWRLLDSVTRKFTTMESFSKVSEPRFDMLAQSDGENTDEFALTYLDRFNKWCDEIKGIVIRSKIGDKEYDYRNQFTDVYNVARVFNYYCGRNFKNHEQISPVEYRWMQKCNNAGLMYLNPKYVDKTVKSYGYDYRGYYPLLLNSDELLIPTKQGTERTLKALPTKRSKLQPGYYHCMITSDDDDFRKIFSFSRDNVYLDISLAQAMRYSKAFSVKIELVQDGRPNAYLYEPEDMVTLHSITSSWYNKMNYLKKCFPKNRLVKHLMSSAWSTMNKKNIVTETLDQIEKRVENGEKVGFGDDNDWIIIDEKKYLDEEGDTKKVIYTLLNAANPIKYNIRLKSYVTAHGRNMIGEIARENIDGVIRIHTDCVVFNSKMEFDDENLIPEDKTTGKIHWKHVNDYDKV